MNQSSEKILSIFDNQTDSIVEKLDDLRINIDQIRPVLYLMELATEIEKIKDTSVNLQNIDKKLNFSAFAKPNCSVCFIKEMTIQSLIESIDKLDKDINEKLETDYMNETNNQDFFDED